MAKRFTDAQKQAALADLGDGMTLEQASKAQMFNCEIDAMEKDLGRQRQSGGQKTPHKDGRFIGNSAGTRKPADGTGR
jgi:hypothetical protein